MSIHSTEQLETGITITKTGTGASASVYLPPVGHFSLLASSAGAFALDVQQGDDSNFSDAYYEQAPATQIQLSNVAQHCAVVPGGLNYRINITSGGVSEVTVVARRIKLHD